MKAILPFLLCAAAVTSYAATSVPPAAFTSFEYTGKDTVFEAQLPADSYRNPLLAGFYPDPSAIRVGDDYYLVNSTFSYFPGLPVFHSRDLVHWKQIGNVIDRADQLNYDDLGVSRGLFAPTIRYHEGKFYVICTMVDSGGNFFVTATNPAGPWSDPVWMHFEGIDPSFFFDNDGRAWVVNNGAPDEKPRYEGHRAIWIQEFSVREQTLIGPRSVIVNGGVDISKKPVWIEGPHLYKREGWYYLCCAEGGTSENHSQVIFRSRAVTGPYMPWDKNPILTQRDLPRDRPNPVTSTGHTELVDLPDGSWWSIFLGCRPYSSGYYATGRETFSLPVTWTSDGWPIILPPGQPVPYQSKAPFVAKNAPGADSDSDLPLTGNFTWRADFTTPKLHPSWLMLRRPREQWWKLENTTGTLQLTPRASRLSGTGNPSYLARRVQHARFDAIATLTSPASSGMSAGLAVFQNENHHYYLGVRRTAEGLAVFVEGANGKEPQVLTSIKLPNTESLRLKISVRDDKCSFACATAPDAWKTILSDADARLLTTQVAGGFVGATVGLHARLEQ